jgi:hypothetical protein
MEKNQRIKEDFRHLYFTRYGIKLDDEILLILIRINEMHKDVKKEIKNSPKIQFRNSRDYLCYGIGRVMGIVLAALLVANILFLLSRT